MSSGYGGGGVSFYVLANSPKLFIKAKARFASQFPARSTEETYQVSVSSC